MGEIKKEKLLAPWGGREGGILIGNESIRTVMWADRLVSTEKGKAEKEEGLR